MIAQLCNERMDALDEAQDVFSNRGTPVSKKYAPDRPDPRWHRPRDIAYIRELLAAAGLSARKAGPILGMAERSFRNRLSGDQDLSYPEQYCLEVLADTAGGAMNTVHEAAPESTWRTTHTVWHRASERALGNEDVGLLIAAVDRFGAPIYGTLIRDSFSLFLKELSGGGNLHHIPIDRVAMYTLLDPPSSEAMR